MKLGQNGAENQNSLFRIAQFGLNFSLLALTLASPYPCASTTFLARKLGTVTGDVKLRKVTMNKCPL